MQKHIRKTHVPQTPHVPVPILPYPSSRKDAKKARQQHRRNANGHIIKHQLGLLVLLLLKDADPVREGMLGVPLATPADGTRVMEGRANGGAGAGAGGFGGRCAGVPYLAMLLCDEPGSPGCDAIRFMVGAEVLPCML